MTDKVHESIKSLVLIPGSGEFIYDTKIITDGYGFTFNSAHNDGKSDAVSTIDSLSDKFPNLKNVSLVVAWFMDTTDAGSITIGPRVESSERIKKDTWSVGDLTRKTAVVSDSEQGTPSDQSVVHIVKYLNDKGYNVTLYPMLFGDNEGESWRGSVKAESHKDVDNFYNEYNKFITHYASLECDGIKLKEILKSYIIGSEMEELLKYDDGSHQYYAVQKMAELASSIKQIVGDNVKTLYAANWTEYGPTDEGYYHLDPLYDKVDAVGIDAYFPLTNGLTQDQITKDALKSGWAKIAELQKWYTSEHINPDGGKTSWIPSSKEVIATEMGFPSVDAASEDPSSFYYPGMDVSSFPGSSSGTVDFDAQRLAIEASIEYWQELHANDKDHKLDKLFADDGGIFWYSYDIRGDLSLHPDEYSDADVYMYGHWIKDY